MKVLWSVNTLSPEIAKEFSIASAHAISWVDAMSKEIKKEEDVSLAIVAPCGNRGGKIIKKEIEGVVYYILPKDDTSVSNWNIILDEYKPEIIHAYGTEGKHNIGLLDAANDKIPVIISLQGLIGEYSKYYYAGLTKCEILKNYTIGDILIRNGIFEKKRAFIKQAAFEKEMLRRVNYVEGRSDWDRVYSKKLNRNLKYYYCPRMLRESFRNYQWNYEKCEKYSILVHQATYPIKGLHMMLDALAEIKKDYPNVIMYIAGKTNLDPKTFKEKLLYGGYTKMIKKKISKLNLDESIEFTGYLSAEQMAEKLSKVNVCVIPSAIENAPNALAEAMIVGTPLVSSYVGGSPDMLNEGQCGLLYRYEEPEMLADRVISYFTEKELCNIKSENARKVAMKRHDRDKLVIRLKNIYKDVIQDFKQTRN